MSRVFLNAAGLRLSQMRVFYLRDRHIVLYIDNLVLRWYAAQNADNLLHDHEALLVVLATQ
jgi:hypothetical protein